MKSSLCVCVGVFFFPSFCHVEAVPLSAVSSLSLDGEEMSKFEKIYPAMQARVRQRRLNLDNGFVDDEDVDQEGEWELGGKETGRELSGGRVFIV